MLSTTLSVAGPRIVYRVGKRHRAPATGQRVNGSKLTQEGKLECGGIAPRP